MASYVKSNEIQVFPAGFRRSAWNQAKLTTEDNLTGFFGKLSKNAENNKFYFTLNGKHYIGIDGYIFVINRNSLPGTHAYIKLKDLGGQIGSRLDNVDTSGNLLDSSDTASESLFQGLAFDTSVPTGGIGFELGSGQPLRLDSDEIRNITRGTAVTGSIHDSFTTNHINGCELVTVEDGFSLSGGSTTATMTVKSNVTVDTGSNINIGTDVDAPITIDGPITVDSQATVTIKKPFTSYATLTVGSSTTNYNGAVEIKSAGPSLTTIIGPNNGTINFPTNPTLNGTYAFVSTRGGIGTPTITPSMQIIEAFNGTNTYAAGTNTIVQRSSAGVAIQKIHTEKVCTYGTNTNLILSAATSGEASAVINAASTTATWGQNPTGTMVVVGGLCVSKNIASGEGIDVASVTSKGNISAASNSFVVSKSSTTASLNLAGATNCIVTIGDNSTGNGILNIYGKPTGSTTSTLMFRVNPTLVGASVPIKCSQAVTGYNFVATNTATSVGSYTYSFANRESNPSFYVTTSGEVTAKSYNATSDIRKKENIVEFTPAKSILGLNVKKFDYIDGPKNQIGCIAQDLKEICPEIVNEDNEGYLTIQENKLVYLLLEEVKQLRKEVNELKNK